MHTVSLARRINGRSYTVQGKVTEHGLRVKFEPDDPKFSTLCNVIYTAWIHDPYKLLTAVKNRSAQGWEGEVAWTFNALEDDPGPGVSLCYFDEELVVSEDEFVQFVSEYTLAYFEAAEALGISTESDEPLRKIALDLK